MIDKSIEELADGLARTVDNMVCMSVRAIILQLKHQVIFSKCRYYVKRGIKPKEAIFSESDIYIYYKSFLKFGSKI